MAQCKGKKLYTAPCGPHVYGTSEKVQPLQYCQIAILLAAYYVLLTTDSKAYAAMEKSSRS